MALVHSQPRSLLLSEREEKWADSGEKYPEGDNECNDFIPPGHRPLHSSTAPALLQQGKIIYFIEA